MTVEKLKSPLGAEIVKKTASEASQRFNFDMYNKPFGNSLDKFYPDHIWQWLIEMQNKDWLKGRADWELPILFADRLSFSLDWRTPVPKWMLARLINEFPYQYAPPGSKPSESFEFQMLMKRTSQVWNAYRNGGYELSQQMIDEFAKWNLFCSENPAMFPGTKVNRIFFLDQWEKLAQQRKVKLSANYYKLREAHPIEECEKLLKYHGISIPWKKAS